MLLIGVGGFVLASMTCAMAATPAMLILARAGAGLTLLYTVLEHAGTSIGSADFIAPRPRR